MSGEDSISSPDEIAVLQAYIDLINSERETIWAPPQRTARCQFADHRRACHQPHGAVGEQMGGPCVDRSRPPHQRRVARDHAAGMVGDEAACRSCEKIRLDLLQASAECARRDPLRPSTDEYSSPRLAGDSGLHAHVSRTGLCSPRFGLSAAIPASMRCCVLSLPRYIEQQHLVTEYQS